MPPSNPQPKPGQSTRALSLDALEAREVMSAAAPTSLLALDAQVRVDAPSLPPEGGETYVLIPARAVVTSEAGELAPARPGNHVDLALDFLRANAPAMGGTAADAAAPFVTDSYREVGGTTHVYVRQEFNGLPVLNAVASVHLTDAGAVFAADSAFVPGLAAAETGVPTPTLSAAEAAAAAAADARVGYPLSGAAEVVSAAGGLDRATTLRVPGLSNEPVTAKLAYNWTPDGVRLVWSFNAPTADGLHWFDVAVDAEDGRLWQLTDWAQNLAAYRVVAQPGKNPLEAAPSVEVNPADPRWSPFGWHDTNGLAGAEFTDTRGNNAYVQTGDPPTFLDPDGDFDSGFRPDGTSELQFLGAFNATPSKAVPFAVQNLFYWTNTLHDLFSDYGFTEAAGNFQQTNYSRQGLSGDPVLANVSDGTATTTDIDGVEPSGNGFFIIPPDGTSPRLQQYYVATGAGLRDSALDSTVTIHEYGHGVTTRLTGGPANSNGLQTVQSAGMGEGWSDFFALMFTLKEGDQKQGAYSVGSYTAGTGANSPGVRRLAYSFAPTYSPNVGDTPRLITFQDYNDDPVRETHNTGEIWASALFDLNWLLVDKYGLDPDYSTGFAPGGSAAGAGNKLALQLVMEALKIQPVNPSFIDGRNALLAADRALTGGLNQREIWTAFARRGLGFGATTGGSNDLLVGVSATLPPAMTSAPGVIGQALVSYVPGGSSSVALTFSEPMNAASFDVATDILTFAAPDGTDLRGNITGAVFSPDKTTLSVAFNATKAQGIATLVLSSDVRAADNGAKLDQNLNGIAGEAVADRYNAFFRVDLTDLVVSATTPAPNGDLAVGTSFVDVAFNEAINPATISPDDLRLSFGSVTAVAALDDTNKLFRFTVTTDKEQLVFAQMRYNAVQDVFGFASDNKSWQFYADFVETPINPDFQRVSTLGWASSVGDKVTFLRSGDADDILVNLTAGQRLSIVDTPNSAMKTKVEFVDPLGNVIATKTGAATGGKVLVNDLAASVTGTYRVRVSFAGGTEGEHEVQVFLNTVQEAETYGGAANNTAAAAQSLDPAFGTFGNTRQAVVQGVSQAAGDFYSFTAVAGETFSLGLGTDQIGATLTLALFDPSGAPVTLPAYAFGPENYFKGGLNITAVTAGKYAVRVSDTGVNNYYLTVIKNGTLDTEPNNIVENAQVLTGKGGARGGIGLNDVDWYTVSAGASELVVLSTLTPGRGDGYVNNQLDPLITVFNAAGDQIALDDNSFDGTNGLIQFLSAAKATYTVRVSAVGGTQGEYVLNANVGPDVAPTGVTAGGILTISEGKSLFLAATAVEPNGQPLFFSWDINGDGLYDDAVGQNPVLTWDQVVNLGLGDGPVSKPVSVIASDGTLSTESADVTLTINNTAPTGKLVGTVLFEGRGGTVNVVDIVEPSPIDLAAGLRFAYDFDNDGKFDDGDGTYAGSPTGTAVQAVPAAFAPFGKASQTVRVRILDKDGGKNDYTVTLPIENSPPTATLVTTGSAVEGGSGLMLEFQNVADTSPSDTSKGIRFSYDFNNDGTFDLGDGTYIGSTGEATVMVPSAFLVDGPAPIAFRARAIDIRGAFTDFTVSASLANADPSATFASDGVVGLGEASTLRFSNPTDPGSADVAAGFRYSFDFTNDGTFDVVDSATAFASFAYPAAGTYTARGRITDKDGGFTEYTAAVTVIPVAPTATLVSSGPVAEGGSAVVTFSGATSPDAALVAAGFRYAYDFDNDGVFEIGDGTYAGSVASSVASVPPQFTDDGPRDVVVRGRVIDAAGQVRDYTTTISVTNVAPTGTLTAVGRPAARTPVTFVFSNVSDPSTADTAAGFRYSFDFNNNGSFADAGDVLNGTEPEATTVFRQLGTYTVRARVTDKDGGFTDRVLTFEVGGLAVADDPRFATGADTGSPPNVRLFNSLGGETASFLAFESSFTGGVRVATGDVNGDGVADVLVGSGPGRANEIVLFDGRTRAVLFRANPFETSFTGGLFVAVGDMTGDGKAEFAVSPDEGGGPRVKVYNSDFTQRADFFGIEDPNFRGGARVSIADVNGDRFGDLLVAAGFGGGPRIALFDGTSVGGTPVKIVGDFFVFEQTLRNGVFVAGGDLDGDGFAEIVLGGGPGGGPRVFVLGGNAVAAGDTGPGAVRANFFAGDAALRGGVRVAVRDATGDGLGDLITGTGVGAANPQVRTYAAPLQGSEPDTVTNFEPLPGFQSGVWVG